MDFFDPTNPVVKLGVIIAAGCMALMAYRLMGKDAVTHLDALFCLGGLAIGIYQSMTNPLVIAHAMIAIPFVCFGAWLAMPSVVTQMAGKHDRDLVRYASKYIFEAGVFLYAPIMFFVIIAR